MAPSRSLRTSPPLTIGLALALALLVAVPAQGAVRKVPQQFPTIQDAVDAANPGDRVEVAKRGNFERVVVNTHNLAIVGVRKGVFVDGHDNSDDSKGHEFDINANNVRVKHMGIRNGSGIDCSGERCVFDRLRFGGAIAGECIDIGGDSASIRRSTLRGCSNYVLAVSGSDATVAGNRFAHGGTDCIYLGGDRMAFRNNEVFNCDGAGLTVSGDAALARNNTIRNTHDHLLAIQGERARVLQNRGGNANDTCFDVSGPLMRVRANRIQSCVGGLQLNGENPKVINNRMQHAISAPGFDIACTGGADACETALIHGNRSIHVADDAPGFNILQGDSTGSMRIARNAAINSADEGYFLNGVDRGAIVGNVARTNGINGQPGFDIAGAENLLRGNVAVANHGDGFYVDDDGNRLEDNVAYSNDGDGVEMSGFVFDTVALRNRTVANLAEGIDNGGTDTVVRRNISRRNRWKGDCVNDGTIAQKLNNQCADGSNFNEPPHVSRPGVGDNG